MCAAWGWGRRPPAATPLAPSPRLPFVIRWLAQLFVTCFHRFLARFSGRRRTHGLFHHKSPPWTILALVIVSSSLFSIVDACSSRTTPKPRPPTSRPNVTFHTYECPPDYAAWYCLNGATCFTVKIGPSLLYNCECSPGYMGVRCEYKDLDRSYLQAKRDYMLSQASIAGGATIAVFLVVIVCAMTYLHYKRRAKLSSIGKDCVDGGGLPPARPTFGLKWKTPPPPPQPNADLPLAVVLQHQRHLQQQHALRLQHAHPHHHPHHHHHTTTTTMTTASEKRLIP